MSPSIWKRIAFVAFVVAEIAVVVLVGWMGRSAPSAGVVARGSDASIEVSAQRAISTTVTVDRVVAPAPSWVVIRAQSSDGMLGSVLGSAHVDVGVNMDVPVSLEPTTLPGEATAILLADRGMAGKLEYVASGAGAPMGDLEADVPYIVDDAYVSDSFSIQPLSNQVTPGEAAIGSVVRARDGSSIVASDVVVPGPSWLVVSVVTTTGGPNRIIGETPVKAGLTPRVPVALQSSLASQTLVATLHVDLGQPGRFEYASSGAESGPDRPYVAGGQTVAVFVPPTKRHVSARR